MLYSSLFPCCTYRIKNISLFHGYFEFCNETELIVVLLGLYICRSIIGYGQFVYKLVTVARGTARVDAV
jgi:hypothetical protein